MDVGWGETVGRGRSKRLSRTGRARVGGDVRLSVGWLRHRLAVRLGEAECAAVPGRGELGFPGPALWQMQSEAARRAGEPSRPGPKKRRRRVLVVTICSPRPVLAVQRARLWAISCTASQAPLAAKRPEGR